MIRIRVGIEVSQVLISGAFRGVDGSGLLNFQDLLRWKTGVFVHAFLATIDWRYRETRELFAGILGMSQYPEQVANLIVNFIWRVCCLSNLLPQQESISFSHAMQGNAACFRAHRQSLC